MRKNNRVLLVDDDIDDQQFLREAINDLFPNLECIAINNGKEALRFIEENPPPPQYIFLDLNMPYVNGFEFLKEFKREDGNSETTIYIYSTSSNPTDREKARILGADDYIVKYSDFDALKIKLRKVIQPS
jgi:DNA-binding response OmpR family regulator